MAEPATLAARAETLSKVGAPLLGVIYVLGFIVSALHLARFGVSSVGLVNAQYVLAGIWLLVPLAFVAAVVGLIAYTFTPEFAAPERERWGIGQKIAATILGLVGMFILMGGPAAYIAESLPRSTNPLTGSFVAVALRVVTAALFVAFFAVVIAYLAKQRAESNAARFNKMARFATFAFFGMLSVAAYIVYFTREIYPHIPATIGGGAPVPVRLHLDGSDRECKLLLLTDHAVVILENGKALELPRDSVKGIDHL